VKSRWHLIQRRIKRQAWRWVGLPQYVEQIEIKCGEQPQGASVEETWDSPMMNDEVPSGDFFDYWLNGNPY
jgi:hypothetical protein